MLVFETHLKVFNSCFIRSSHQRCSVKKGVLRNFAKFTGKRLCQSLFFKKVAGGAFFTFFTEHVWATASFLYILTLHRIKENVNMNLLQTTISSLVSKNY